MNIITTSIQSDLNILLNTEAIIRRYELEKQQEDTIIRIALISCAFLYIIMFFLATRN